MVSLVLNQLTREQAWRERVKNAHHQTNIRAVCGNPQVAKIKEHGDVQWRYVSTEENPADLASRGGSVDEKELWWSGPMWLSDDAK